MNDFLDIEDGGISVRLAESERRLRLATEAAGIGIWEWLLDKGELIYSARAREICGFPETGDVTIEMARAVTHPEDHPRTSAQSKRALDPDIRLREPYRYRIIRADDGEIRWVLAYGEAIFEEVQGLTRATRYVGTLQDITEEKRQEQRLIESEGRLRLALEAGGLAVWEVDIQRETVSVSPELNRIMGFPPDARPTLDEYRRHYAPGERERLQKIGREALAASGRIQEEIKLVWPDGSEHWALLNAQFAPGSAGPSERVIGTLLDITERKRAELKLAVIAREMQHRAKNTLAIVQSLANQAFRGQASLDEAREAFSGRLAALAVSADLLFARPGGEIVLGEIVSRVLAPYRDLQRDQFFIKGSEVLLSENAAIGIGLALHELATNAVKYGALSVPEGRVEIAWVHSGSELVLEWVERNGPPVQRPSHSGFGTQLLQSLATSMGGESELDYRPVGLFWRFRKPQ